jgi:beta-galactosidase
MPHDLPIWLNYGLDSISSQLRSFTISEQSPTSVCLRSTSYLSPPVLAWGFLATTTYSVSASGALTISTHLVPTGSFPQHLPRIGLDCALSNTLSRATYFGLGPGESYPDTHSAQKVGIYTAPVDQLHTPYEVPQENGNRMGARWVQMVDERGDGVRATRTTRLSLVSQISERGRDDEQFHWAASRYSAAELTRARHPHELVASPDTIFWRLDVKTAGVGTGACGPGVMKKYQVECREMEFGFMLDPVTA